MGYSNRLKCLLQIKEAEIWGVALSSVLQDGFLNWEDGISAPLWYVVWGECGNPFSTNMPVMISRHLTVQMLEWHSSSCCWSVGPMHPLSLWTGTIIPSLKLDGIYSRWMIVLKVCFSHTVRTESPFLRCFANRPSAPPLLFIFTFFKALLSSSIVIGTVKDEIFKFMWQNFHVHSHLDQTQTLRFDFVPS